MPAYKNVYSARVTGQIPQLIASTSLRARVPTSACVRFKTRETEGKFHNWQLVHHCERGCQQARVRDEKCASGRACSTTDSERFLVTTRSAPRHPPERWVNDIRWPAGVNVNRIKGARDGVLRRVLKNFLGSANWHYSFIYHMVIFFISVSLTTRRKTSSSRHLII